MKKNKIYLVITIFVITCIALGGCKSEPVITEKEEIIFSMPFCSISERGICKSVSDMGHFWDVNTGKELLLCTNPNCRHIKLLKANNGIRCNAYLGERAQLLFMTKENLYYLAAPDNSTDVMSSIFDKELIRADIDGNNRKRICSFEDVENIVGVGDAFCLNQWFAFGYINDNSREQSDGISLDNLEKRITGVYLVNLEDGTKYLLDEREEYSAAFVYVYISDSKVYALLLYTSEELKWSPDTADTAEQQMDKLREINRYELCSYDIETKEKKIIWEGRDEYANPPSDGYFIFDSDEDSLFIKNGEEVARYKKTELSEHHPEFIRKYVYKDILYMTDLNKVWCMDLKTGTIKAVADGKLDGKSIDTIYAINDNTIYYDVVSIDEYRMDFYATDFDKFLAGDLEGAKPVIITE